MHLVAIFYQNKYLLHLVILNFFVSEIKIGMNYIKDGSPMEGFPADMKLLENITVSGQIFS